MANKEFKTNNMIYLIVCSFSIKLYQNLIENFEMGYLNLSPHLQLISFCFPYANLLYSQLINHQPAHALKSLLVHVSN